MKNTKTVYQILLDQSGSMRKRQYDVHEGFNEQITSLKQTMNEFTEQNLKVSLSFFNEQVDHILKDVDINEVPMLNELKYKPNGTTSLLDAIGECIYNLRSIHGRDLAEEKATVIFLIFTDGMENSSKSFGYYQIKNLIDELESTDQWLFSFIGSDMEGIRFAETLSIKESNLMYFTPSKSKQALSYFSKEMSYYIAHKRSTNKPPKDLFKNDSQNILSKNRRTK